MTFINVDCPNCGCKIHIEPKQKRGKWIKWEAKNGIDVGLECSCCKYHIFVMLNCYGYNFCPNCGANMK